MQEAIREAQIIRDSPIGSTDPILAEINRFLLWKKDRGHFTAASLDSRGGAVLRKFAEHIEGKPVHIVTPAMVKAWHQDLEKPYRKTYKRPDGTVHQGPQIRRTDSTINGYLMTVRSFFEWAVKVRKCARENPVAKIDLFRTSGTARMDCCKPDLRDKLIRECKRPDPRFILFCGFHAEIRMQEIVEAKAFWFEVDSKQIHLRKHEGI